MRKLAVFGTAVFYITTARFWAMAFLGQYPPGDLTSAFWPYLRWFASTLGLFGLTACGAWYVQVRGIRPRTMRAAVVLSGATALIGLVGNWCRVRKAWLTPVYFLETAVATSAVALLWAGLVSIPRFKGWRRGMALVTATSIQIIAAVTVLSRRPQRLDQEEPRPTRHTNQCANTKNSPFSS